jgi:hypothetical protein
VRQKKKKTPPLARQNPLLFSSHEETKLLDDDDDCGRLRLSRKQKTAKHEAKRNRERETSS